MPSRHPCCGAPNREIVVSHDRKLRAGWRNHLAVLRINESLQVISAAHKPDLTSVDAARRGGNRRASRCRGAPKCGGAGGARQSVGSRGSRLRPSGRGREPRHHWSLHVVSMPGLNDSVQPIGKAGHIRLARSEEDRRAGIGFQGIALGVIRDQRPIGGRVLEIQIPLAVVLGWFLVAGTAA